MPSSEDITIVLMNLNNDLRHAKPYVSKQIGDPFV
jgi:hypothetical protein